MTTSEAAEFRLVGFEGGGRHFWHCTRRGAALELRHGPGDGRASEGAKLKEESKSFPSEAAAVAFVAKQVKKRVDRGYHADLPFELARWGDVKGEVLPHLAGNSERDDDRVLVCNGDTVFPHDLWLDYRQGLLTLASEAEAPFVGLLVRGDLTIEGCLHNFEDDHGPLLLVTGDLRAHSVATGGSQMCVLGELSADVVIGVYNHGSLEAKGALRARVIASEHRVAGAPMSGIHYRGWGRNALPLREGVVDDREPYEPRGLFVAAVMKGEQVELRKARELAVAGKQVLKDELVTVREAFRKLVGKKLADPDKVKSLSLPGKDLTFLPEELFAFRKLEKLTLTHNKLRHLPEELGQLTELRELHLRGNGLQELPESIGQLTQLRVLDLEANCIWRLPDSLARCTELRTVNLTNNPYSYVRASFGGWAKVKLMWELPEVLTRLPRLEQLTFDGTFLRQLPRRHFDSPHLRRATIHNSLVTELDPALHGQLAVSVGESRERAVNYIRYWFDDDELHLSDFYDVKRDHYDFTEVRALLALLLEISIPTAAPYDVSLAQFDKQCRDVIRGMSWGGKNSRQIQALFRALGEALDEAEVRYPDNALVTGLRPIFAQHAG